MRQGVVNDFLLEETRKLRLREEKGPAWGDRGNKAGTRGWRQEGGKRVRREEGEASHLPCQGPSPSCTHWKQELVKGELERRERKQTESEESLELEVLGLFGLAEPPPGPLPTTLQIPTTPTTCVRAHTCSHTCTHTQLHTGTHSHTVRHAHIHTHKTQTCTYRHLCRHTYTHAQTYSTEGPSWRAGARMEDFCGSF